MFLSKCSGYRMEVTNGAISINVRVSIGTSEFVLTGHEGVVFEVARYVGDEGFSANSEWDRRPDVKVHFRYYQYNFLFDVVLICLG